MSAQDNQSYGDTELLCKIYEWSSMDMNETVDKIEKALKTLRVGVTIAESALQNKISEILAEHGIQHIREYKLGRGCRADFLCWVSGELAVTSAVVVEVKKGKPNWARLEAQVSRYAEFDIVEAVVIAVASSLRNPIPETSNGKPCVVIGLQKQWGIAL